VFNLYNFVAYQLAWFAVILTAARGAVWAGALVALLVTAVHLGLRREPLELKLIGIAAVFGLIVDTTLSATGLVRFADPSPVPLAPYWMLALWIAFATTLNHSLRWLLLRPPVAALGGAIGGPLAYLAGEKLGALTLASPTAALPVIGALWIAAMWGLSILIRSPLLAARSQPA
jgi:Protein of unknown function (DUF2878)